MNPLSTGLQLKSIQLKIALWTGVCLLLTATIIIAYAALSLRRTAVEIAENRALAVAETQANVVQTKIETALTTARTLAQVLAASKTEEGHLRFNRAEVNAALRQVLVDNPEFLAIYTIWEPNTFDGEDTEHIGQTGHDQTGRFIPYWSRNRQGKIQLEPSVAYEVEGAGDYYQCPKRTNKECIINPYLYPVQGEDVLITSLVAPVMAQGKFYGIVGVDIRLEFLQQLANQIDIYDKSGRLALVSHNGTLAAVTDQPQLIGQNVRDMNPGNEAGNNLARIQQGEQFIEYQDSELAVFVPIKFGQTETPWSVNVLIPAEKIAAEATRLMWRLIGIGGLLAGLGLGLLWLAAGQIAKPIRQITQAVRSVTVGNLDIEAPVTSKDELAVLAAAFNQMTAHLRQRIETEAQINTQLTAEIAERQRAEAALNRFANRLKVLHEIDRAILSAHSPQEIAQTALRYIRQLVPCRRAVVSVLDFAANEVLTLAIDVDTKTKVKMGSRTPLALYRNLISQLRQGQVISVQVDRMPDDLPPEIIETAYAEGTHFGTLFPLIAPGELIGSVNLWEASLIVFSAEQMNTVREVADQLAIALQQARLFEAEAQRRQEAEALRDTAAALNSTLNLEEVLDRILSNVGRVVQHELVNIALIESGVTHVVRAQGYDKHGRGEAVLKSQHALADTPTLRRMVEMGQPVVIPDTETDPDWVVKDEPWLRAYIGVPIRMQGEVIGVLNLDSDTPGVFTTAHAEHLQAFADQAAVAIQNARLYAETQQRAEHLAVLHELDRAITASLDSDQVYRAFAQQTLRLLPYDFMSINLVEGDSLYLSYAAGEEPLPPAGSRVPLKTLEMSRIVVEQGQSFLSADLVSEQRFAVYQPVITMGMRSAIILPLRIKGQVIGVWFLACRQVEGYGPDDLVMAQSVAEQLAIAIENSRLFEQVQHYTTELEQRVTDRTRELSALYEVTAVASESLNLKMMLELILERVLGAMRSQIGGIHLLNETGETLHQAVQQGFPPDLAAQLETLPVGMGLPGWVIKQAGPLIVPDVALDLRSVEAGRIGFQAYAGVPIRAGGRMLGVLSVARAKGQPHFNVEEVALLTTIADQVGVVVESARLRQLAEQSAVMEERARLARDLHDSVTQLLYSVNLFATVGREAYNLGDMTQVYNCLIELGQIAQQALKEMRLLVYELRPLALAQEGLIGALRQRLDAVERRAGVQTELQAETTLDLPRQVEEALYHIAQEALNNALKHAAATAVTVSIGASNGRIELEVTDNGAGFDLPTAEGKGGLGLTSMQERVEKMGGLLTILSTPGEGTKVKVSLEV
ncbi:MAG: GAF domain-containing protein [Anaerolineae bacterium]|nr:GAF domain-containing protein [Anaerolineae bacterium]